MSSYSATAVELSCEQAIPVARDQKWLDRLLETLADAQFVLLGEATHGTHEFYALRATTKRLCLTLSFI
jgi:erythromycin esterase-like protein